MGVAYYPDLEVAIEGYNPAVEVSGKAVARAMEQLDEICVRIGQKTLSSFYSESNAEAYESIGEDPPDDLPEGEGVQWTEPADGLRTVSALADYVRSHGGEFSDAASLVSDLQAFRTVFSNALAHGTRFRLRIDI